MKPLVVLLPLLLSAGPLKAATADYLCHVYLQQFNPRGEVPNSRKEFRLLFDEAIDEDASYGSSSLSEATVSLDHDITIKTALWLQYATYKTSPQLPRILKQRVSVLVGGQETVATTGTVDRNQPELNLRLNDDLQAISECLRK